MKVSPLVLLCVGIFSIVVPTLAMEEKKTSTNTPKYRFDKVTFGIPRPEGGYAKITTITLNKDKNYFQEAENNISIILLPENFDDFPFLKFLGNERDQAMRDSVEKEIERKKVFCERHPRTSAAILFGLSTAVVATFVALFK